MPVAQALILLAAAFLGGAVNAVAGGGTIITFSALLALGLDSRIANATSTVALVPGYVGGAMGFRDTMRRETSLVMRLLVPSILGGGIGTGLLILTPTTIFSRLVPYLVLLATLIFSAKDWLARHLRASSSPGRGRQLGAAVFQLVVAVYGGYFGAGVSILILAGIMLLGVRDINAANGVKNVLSLLINAVAVIGFIAFGLVDWPRAGVMVAGAALGGYQGARLARRVGPRNAQRLVIAVGLALTAYTLWKQLT